MPHAQPGGASEVLVSEGELCLDLMNSLHFDYRGRRPPQDNLEHSEWLSAFAARWRLPVDAPPDGFALTGLRSLRALLQQMFATFTAGEPLTEAQLEELNTFLALSSLKQQVQRTEEGIQIQLVPLQTGWTAVLTQVAASWVKLLARTPPERLKVCANPVCHWVFVDQSHSLSRRWCRLWACGNLMKVRQFRAQRAHAENT